MDRHGSARLATPEDVFTDFRARRDGILKALTTDVEKFYKLCDPEYKDNLCLYGLPNKTWEVNVPAAEIPPELPEPAEGINVTRDSMPKEDWLSFVAVHSDAWLVAVAFHFGALHGFDKDARRQLHIMINNHPTVYEVVIGSGEKQPKAHNTNYETKSSSIKEPSSSSKLAEQPLPKKERQIIKEDGGDKDEAFLCGTCGGMYSENGVFWIGCDICDKWYHGDCVRITPAEAKHIDQYGCPACSNKRNIE
uniref:PHD finger protein ALFIN-LIKE n=1 Tax=Zea mays TaxID=4577 RepID=A0A804RIA5_MAIZE